MMSVISKAFLFFCFSNSSCSKEACAIKFRFAVQMYFVKIKMLCYKDADAE